jgi:serine/threonine-protein kinase
VEVGEDASGLYVVMDYIEGGSVADLVHARRALPRPVALRIVLDALSGLTAAHALTDVTGAPLDIVHRDVSPQNILVGVDGLSRLTDFGIARAASRLYEHGKEMKGKLGYMAPEQVLGHPADRRADVFAMGIVLWELLAGRPLFRADNDAESINRLMYRPIPRLAQAAPDAPPQLDEICARALEREPEARFPTATAFLDALEQAALATCGVASHREVAAAVEQILGDPLRAARELLRNKESTRPPPPAEEPDARASTVRAVITDKARVHTRPRAQWAAAVLLACAIAATLAFARVRGAREGRAVSAPSGPPGIQAAIEVPEPATPVSSDPARDAGPRPPSSRR